MSSLYEYGEQILGGTIVSLEVACFSLLLAMLFGLVGAMAKFSSFRPLSLFASCYTTIMRTVPDIVLLLLFFYGGQVFFNRVAPLLGYPAYIDINPYPAGIAIMGFIFGAPLSETFYRTMLDVGGERGGGHRNGRGFRFRLLQYLLRPQSFGRALPDLRRHWLKLIKSSALVSIIGLDDLVGRAASVAGVTGKPFTLYGVVALNYLLIAAVSIWLFRYLEKKWCAAEREG